MKIFSASNSGGGEKKRAEKEGKSPIQPGRRQDVLIGPLPNILMTLKKVGKKKIKSTPEKAFG